MRVSCTGTYPLLLLALCAVIDGDEIVYRDYVDISIAVATPKGLVVPVLRNADDLSFAECEKVRDAALLSVTKHGGGGGGGVWSGVNFRVQACVAMVKSGRVRWLETCL
jgi:hypothetical protein